MSLSQPQNNRKQDGYSAEKALQRGFSAGLFLDLKATRPRKARTQDTMPLALGRASPCAPTPSLSFDVAPAITLWSHLYPSM